MMACRRQLPIIILLLSALIFQARANQNQEPSKAGAREAWCISELAHGDWKSNLPESCKVKIIDSNYKQIIVWFARGEVFRNGQIEADGRAPERSVVLTGSCLRPDCTFANDYYPEPSRLVYYSPSRMLVEMGSRIWILAR